MPFTNPLVPRTVAWLAFSCALLLCMTSMGCDDRASQFFAMQEELARVVEAHPNDCPAMASALDDFAARDGLRFAQAEQSLLSMNKEQRAEFQAEHAERADRLRKRLAPLAACASEPRVAAALEKLDYGR